MSGHTVLAADTTVDVGAGATLSLNTEIVQNGSDHTLTKPGDGNLVISPTYDGAYGPTDIAAGTLQVDGTLDAIGAGDSRERRDLKRHRVGRTGHRHRRNHRSRRQWSGHHSRLRASTSRWVRSSRSTWTATRAGSGYDQVISNGPVVLNGATLDPTVFGYMPSSTDRLS